MVVADLSNMTIPCNECWGSPRSKNEATGVKIHQTHFRVNKACQSNEQQISRCEDEREFHYDESIKSAQFSLKCSICFKNSIHAVWRGEEPFWAPGKADFDEGKGGGRHGAKTRCWSPRCVIQSELSTLVLVLVQYLRVRPARN